MAEAMVTIVFSGGADALDMKAEERQALAERMIGQLRMLARGAEMASRR